MAAADRLKAKSAATWSSCTRQALYAYPSCVILAFLVFRGGEQPPTLPWSLRRITEKPTKALEEGRFDAIA